MSDKLTEVAVTKGLPSIKEIYEQDELPMLKRAAAFEVLVNQPPKKEWLKNHPTATKEIFENGQKKIVPVQYIPIERVEWLLINIIIRYKTEILDVKQIANSVTVTVRLHYFNPAWNEWTFHDGVGAAPLQTAKGAGAIDWNQIKSAAVQIGAPAAESFAIKDAAEKIGKLFGKDLNRAEIINYEGLADRYEKALSND